MPLAEFGTNKPNELAMLEQAYLITLIYKNQKTIFQQFLDAKGNFVIDVWVFRPEAWPPSLAIFHEVGTKKYHIVVAGTTNVVPQVANHLSGAEGTRINMNLYEHSFFHAAALEIIQQFDDAVAMSQVNKICLSAHSYGMAACCLAGIRFADRLGEENVELLGFSEPRSVAKILVNFFGKSLDVDDRPHPHIHHIIVNYGDVVARLPPAGWDLFLRGTGAKMRRGDLSRVHWWARHWRAKEWLTTFDGGLVQDTEDEEWALYPSNWQKTIESLHYMRTYASKCVDIDRKANGNDNIALQKAMLSAINLPELPKDTVFSGVEPYIQDSDLVKPWIEQFGDPLPQILRQETETSKIAIGSASFSQSGANSGSGSNILNLGESTLAITNYIITSFQNNGIYGFSHRMALKNGLTEAQAKTAAEKVLYARSFLLGNNVSSVSGRTTKSPACPVLEFYRLSSALSPEEGDLVALNSTEYGGPRGFVDNYADNYASALTVRMRAQNVADGSKFTHSVQTFVGFPDGIIKRAAYDGSLIVTSGKTWAEWLKEYLDLLCEATATYGLMMLDPAKPAKLTTKVEADGTTSLVKLTIPAHGLIQGNKVQITGGTKKALRKSWIVNVVDSSVVTLQNSETFSDDLPAQVKVRPIAAPDGTHYLSFAKFISYSSIVKVSHHRPGQQFLGVSFRRRGRRS